MFERKKVNMNDLEINLKCFFSGRFYLTRAYEKHTLYNLIRSQKKRTYIVH